jgi:hypothetical protein
MVAEVQRQALKKDAAGALKRSIEALRGDPKCEPKVKIGLVGRLNHGCLMGQSLS